MASSAAARTVTGMNTLSRRSQWWTPAGLVFLCLVPIGSGIWRLVEIASHPAVTPNNARFLENPLPAVVHMVSAMLFCLFGAFQVTRAPRRASIGWHRLAGRALAPLGVVAGLSGVWLALAYWTLTKDGPVLFSLRLVVGTAMAACVVKGVVCVIAGDVSGHRAWMLRGYGLGIAAGTQFFTHLPLLLLHGGPDNMSPAQTTVAMAAGWLINIVVVERHLRPRSTPHLVSEVSHAR